MPDYLYYKRGEEWVRVNADSYRRKNTNNPDYFEGGQCPERYRVYFEIYYRLDNQPELYTSKGNGTMQGPILGFLHKQYKPPHPNGHGYYWFGRNSQGFTYLGGIYSGPPHEYKDMSGSLIKIERIDGEADNCGSLPGDGGCTTEFTLNGSVVLKLDTCPEVTNGRGCSECCSELVTIAKRIQI